MAASQPSLRSPLLAGLRSFVLPGWGEVWATGSRAGWFLVLISLILANAVVATMVFLGPVEIASNLLNPGVLLGIAAINLAVAIARSMSTGHAWWLAGGRSLAVAVLLGMLVLGPHLAVGWVAFQVRHTLVAVFAPAAPPPIPLPVGTTSSTSTTTTMPGATTTTTPVGDTTTTIPSTTTTTTPFILHQRLNLLLLGGDAGPGRSGLRTDSVMVASIDPRTGEAALFGLPRNLGELRLTTGEPVPGRILNEVYGWARDRGDRFPGIDPGAAAVADVAGYLTGLRIDYFMLVDLTGFSDIVEVFGGAKVNVPRDVHVPIYDPGTGGYRMKLLLAGEQRLNGPEALGYSRTRLDSNDYVRMGRQRCVLSSLADQSGTIGMLTRLPAILDVVETHVTTNIPINLVPDLVRLGAKVNSGTLRTVGFGPEWSLGVNVRGQLIPDVDQIRATVLETITNPSSAPIPTASETCG